MAENKIHFVGVGGSGMSALAQFHAMGGDRVTGSDRLFDQKKESSLALPFKKLGISLFAQDGSGIDAKTNKVVVSGAIESDNPELVQAAELKIAVDHRADALSAHVASHKTIAIAGTSGKSTVTAMTFEILHSAGKSPSLIAGAPLTRLSRKGLIGNAFRGESDILVIEADESDGTLPKYHPAIGVLLNMGKDHKEIEDLRRLFSQFREQSKVFVLNADAKNLAEFSSGAATFGFSAGSLRGENLDLAPEGSWFTVEGVEFNIPQPGRHNAENALAAAAAARCAGVTLQESSTALSVYAGVSRRFEKVGRARDVDVIDDYAHNPDKVRAVLKAAHIRASRVLMVFQPHGFGPTRFLKDEFIEAFSDAMGEKDILWMPEIYYAGGTTVKDISSDDLVSAISSRGRDARSVHDRSAIPVQVAAQAKAGDVVLVLGARDPSLHSFAQSVFDAIKK